MGTGLIVSHVIGKRGVEDQSTAGVKTDEEGVVGRAVSLPTAKIVYSHKYPNTWVLWTVVNHPPRHPIKNS